jgi:hypothetical protein
MYNKRSFQLNYSVVFHYYYFVMFFHIYKIQSILHHPMNIMFLTRIRKKASDVLLEVLHFFFKLGQPSICSSRNDQMSMPYKHQLLIEERANVITIIPWSSLCILFYVKCMNTRSFFKK